MLPEPEKTVSVWAIDPSAASAPTIAFVYAWSAAQPSPCPCVTWLLCLPTHDCETLPSPATRPAERTSEVAEARLADSVNRVTASAPVIAPS